MKTICVRKLVAWGQSSPIRWDYLALIVKGIQGDTLDLDKLLCILFICSRYRLHVQR